MYICEHCRSKHGLKTKPITTSNGLCEICSEPDAGPLAWTDELSRDLHGILSVEGQLAAREALQRSSAPGSAAFTLSVLAAIMAEAPKPPPHRYCTVPPELEALMPRELPPPQTGPWSAFGIQVHVKPGQVAAGWMFSDLKTLRKYLAGELSELDLMGLIETGRCQPTEKASATMKDAHE